MKKVLRSSLFPVLMALAVWLTLTGSALAQQIERNGWPSPQEQMAKEQIKKDSALERLVLENQDFQLLDPAEAQDKIRVPLFLRVIWRKAHPELVYSPNDPSGGYPHVLKEVYEWMVSHQDLQPDEAEPDIPPDLDHTVIGANVRISGAQTTPRSESDIRINFWNPSQVIAGSNNITASGHQAQFYSTNGGATWGQTTLPFTGTDAFHSDPAVDWTSDGTAWALTLGINSSGTQLRVQAYKSTNGGATWTFDSTISGTQTAADKELLWADHSATSPYKDSLYAIWHTGAPAYMNRRTPSGTWGSPIQVSGAESTGTAIGADVKTNAFGDVFGFWPATGNRRIVMVKSTNGGASYATPVVIATAYDSYDIGVPSFNGRRALIYVAGGAYRTASKDLVYATWTDLSGLSGCTSATNEPGGSVSSTCKTRIWFSRSTNGGTTWSTPVKLNDQASLNDQYNQWLAVDETSGRVSVVYYDTVADAGRKKADIWYQTSGDDGASWSAPFRVTTASTDETVSGADLGNQYGDYNGMSAYAGTFLPSWTDRRNNAREEIWTAAVTENPCTPPAAPSGLTATPAGTGQINLLWGLVSGAASYNVYRSTVSGGPYTQIASVNDPTSAYSDTGLAGGTTYYYVVRSFSGCESANSAQASATAAGGGSCSTATLYTNTFESGSGLSDWIKGSFGGSGTTTPWRGIQTCTAQNGSKIFRYGGSGCTTNYTSNNFNFARPVSAGIVVPAGSSQTTLTFGHRRRFESGFDGGTLALSLNGTNYYFVPSSAITAGANYNGLIGGSCAPAGTAGTSVFTGVQTTFVNTTVNLDAACNLITGGSGGCAGQALRIAFTTITDCSATDDGWFLDNVTVTACTP